MSARLFRQPAPDLAERIDALVSEFTGPDDARRRVGVRSALSALTPRVLAHLTDRLILLVGGDEEVAAARAAAALAEVGEFAVPPLTARLFHSENAAEVGRAADVLGRIGATLSPVPRARLRRNLEAALGRASEPDVAAAIRRALAAQEGPTEGRA
jgi:hypothetical protein